MRKDREGVLGISTIFRSQEIGAGKGGTSKGRPRKKDQKRKERSQETDVCHQTLLKEYKEKIRAET